VIGEELTKPEKYLVPLDVLEEVASGKSWPWMNLYLMKANFFSQLDTELFGNEQEGD